LLLIWIDLVLNSSLSSIYQIIMDSLFVCVRFGELISDWIHGRTKILSSFRSKHVSINKCLWSVLFFYDLN